MKSFAQRMEEMDGQTISRRNKLRTVTPENVVTSAAKLEANLQLQPYYPWTNRFEQGEYQLIPDLIGKKKQLKFLNRQMNSLDEFIYTANTDTLYKEWNFPGAGNQLEDLSKAQRLAYKKLDDRMHEQVVVSTLSNQDLANVIKELRGTDLSPTNNEILHMTALQKAEFLVEIQRHTADQVQVMHANL